MVMVTSSVFKEIRAIDLASEPVVLSSIRGEFWCCCNCRIVVFSLNLKRVRDISLAEGVISGAIDVGDCVVVSTEERILTMSYAGTK